MLEFLQLLGLIRIELQQRLTLWTFSYTSISRANAHKKTEDSHARFLTRCLLPGFLCLYYALSVVFDGNTYGNLVLVVHYGLAASSRACLYSFSAYDMRDSCLDGILLPIVNVARLSVV